MLKTSVKTINGRFCTVIRKPFDPEWVREQLRLQRPVRVEYSLGKGYIISEIESRAAFLFDGEYRMRPYSWNDFNEQDTTITILPALQRHPEPEDAALVAAYMREGLFIYGNFSPYGDDALLVDRCGLFAKNRYGEEFQILNRPEFCKDEITHAVDTSGNRIEIAIEDRKVGE